MSIKTFLAGISFAWAGPLLAQAPVMSPCEIPGPQSVVAARCGFVEVPENREQPGGRRLRIRIAIVDGKDVAANPDPIVTIPGGPGQSAVDLIPLAMATWPGASGRTIIAIDQRGSGGSAPLVCPMPMPNAQPQFFMRDLFADQVGLARCRDSLARTADLSRYTSTDAADDLADVLRALGVRQANLAAGSYGTRVALVFIRRHSGMVRSAILNGISPPAMRNPLHHARGAQDAFDRLASDCAADSMCVRTYGDVRATLARVFAAADARPFTADVTLPDGAPATVVVDREALAEGVRAFLYWMPGARQLPKLLGAADRGEVQPLAQAIFVNNINLRATLPFGMLLSVVCGEDVPRIAPASIAAETRGTFLGATRVSNQMAVCREWPRRPLSSDFAAPIPGRVPVLLLSGSHDPATGPAWGDSARVILSNARHVVVPGAHNIGGPCVDGLRLRFLADPSPDRLDVACASGMKLPPFPQ